MAKRTRKPAQVVQLEIDGFMAKHRSEFEENEDVIFFRHFAQQDREKAWGHRAFSAEDFDAWAKAEAAAELAHPGWRRKRELIRELRKYWLVRLLRAAKKENRPDAFRDLLEGWLIRLGVEAPEGVFVPLQGSPGRPRKSSTEEIYRAWEAQEDRNDLRHLAFTIFGRDYNRADARCRKNLRERCRNAVKRHQKYLATKSTR
jgi:hypothetical protein